MKKSEVITFRTSVDVKRQIEVIALVNKWSVAQVVHEICKDHFKQYPAVQPEVEHE